MALCFSYCSLLNPNVKKDDFNMSSKISSLDNVKSHVARIGIPSIITSPHESLCKGNWVKLICGASFEDLADIRNLSLVYTLAGVDCIDCAAEASVVRAVNDGINAARGIVSVRRPWVMISVNDDQDLHFRKAEFDPDECPLDCSRPCENVCPANAIRLDNTAGVVKGGVLAERCYGCGRCFPVCPYHRIREITYIRDVRTTTQLLKQPDVDAIEIHTNGRHADSFEELWNGLGHTPKNLRLVAVSIPDLNDLTVSVMKTLYSIMEANLCNISLWQLDGRPMSGDIGRGATREAIAFALRLASDKGRPKGYLQLAGGTNDHTVDGLKRVGLFQSVTIHEKVESERPLQVLPCSGDALIGGVAFGGYARKIVGKVLRCMQVQHGHAFIEEHPEHLLKALEEAISLFAPRSTLETLVTSADSRIRVIDGTEMIHKYKGFRNTNSQITASLTADGKYVVCASEDSHVYIWRHEGDSRPNRSKSVTVTQAYESFLCQDVTVAVPCPCISATRILDDIATQEHNASINQLNEKLSAIHLTLVKVEEGNGTEMSTNNFFFDRKSATWPEEKLSLAIKKRSPRVSVDFSNEESSATAWGMVIVTAGLKGDIRTFQNFGLPY